MKQINFEIPVKCWRDKETKYWIVYSKKFDISSYGRTKQLATFMFRMQIGSILMYSKPSNKKRK